MHIYIILKYIEYIFVLYKYILLKYIDVDIKIHFISICFVPLDSNPVIKRLILIFQNKTSTPENLVHKLFVH